jgi:hypothetical protein
MNRLAPVTAEDLDVLIADGYLTSTEAEHLEVVTRAEMFARYAPAVQKALGIRPGQPSPKPRNGR